MSPLYTGFPGIIYAGLWILKKVGILKREVPNAKILVLVTDAPPAFMATIENGDFQIEILEQVLTPQDLDSVESDMHIAIPSNYFLGSVEGILDGISKNIIKIKDQNILIMLGKIASVF